MMDNMLTSFFDPSNYSGQQGGLLDLLRKAAEQNAQYQPSAGFPAAAGAPVAAPAQAPAAPAVAADDDEEDKPATPAGPAQASPIGVGNYQMPRFGSAADFTPSPAALPQNAQPAPASPMAGVASAAGGIGSHIAAALQSIGAPGSLFHNVVSNPVSALITGQTPQSQQNQIANMTAKALLAKGVDPIAVQAAIQPGNGELLKTLVTQAYGPQTVQSLGSGYIADKSGKVTRAFEPDEKTPAGFATDDKGMHYVPGGPADPAYLQLKAAKAADPNAVHVLGQNGELYKVDEKGIPTIVHKNTPSADSTLDDATTQAMADQYLAGDRTVLQNLGRGAQGAANIVKLRQTITQRATDAGIDPKGIVNNFNEQAGALAGQRSIGTRAANISLAANEANNMIPIALKASEAVPRTQYMPINEAIQAVQKGTSSPELARFVAATNSLVNSYVRAVSPSGVPTDSMREHAYSMLNAAQSHQAYQAVTSIMQDEMKAAMAAPGQVRKELRHEDDGAPGMAAPAATPAPAQASPPRPLPQPGAVQGGFRFKGGNPADKANWEQVS